MGDRIEYIWRFIFWQFSRLFVYFYLRPKFNFKVEKGLSKLPKAPFIMVSNHGTFFDPWLVGHLSVKPLSIMNNEEAFKASAFQKWYITQIGTFPKKKGDSDFKAMKTTLKRLKKGYSVLIFPEGQTTWDGRFQPIYPGIEKIAKLAKVPVVVMNLRGNFLSKPWWAKNYRRGLVSLSWNIISTDEVSTLPQKVILDRIVSGLSNNDYENFRDGSVKFKGKNLTQGMEHFLWLCPKCKHQDEFVTIENDIVCMKCGIILEVDGNFNISTMLKNVRSIKNIVELSDFQRGEIKKIIATANETDTICHNDDVLFHKLSGTGATIALAKGSLSLSKTDIEFTPEEKGADKISIKVSDVKNYTTQKKDVFEFGDSERTYRFKLNGRSPEKWLWFMRYLNGFEKCEETGIIE